MRTLNEMRSLAFLLLFWLPFKMHAQEGVAPLRSNPALANVVEAEHASAAKTTTTISIPFFEDFTDYSVYPAADRWTDKQVYVNNTMGVGTVSRGVATFDALNERGRPYDTVSSTALVYADSLTSQEFDLSDIEPGDSVYFSFFFQPQGAGFAPETGDSLMLYFRSSNGQFRKQWGRAGGTLQPFTQVMIPVTDTVFFYNGFRFRFVNKASINLNDDVWNLDYIRFAAGRSAADTAIDDPATTDEPQPFLNDYTAMPYRQFIAASSTEKSPNLSYEARNNRNAGLSVPDGFQATLQSSGAVLGSANGILGIGPFAENTRSFSNSVSLPPLGNPTERVVFQNRFFFGDVGNGSSRVNDTILRETVFDNYLAYDDGTAERSYFLNLFPTLPGKIAIEHRLNVADTLRGVSVLFGQQVPTATGKFFTAVVYRKLAGVDNVASDEVVYQQEFLQPSFTDTVNQAQVYPFSLPVAMPPGKFYIGIIQPALSGSDSLYYALDVNRQGSNHLYFNVLNVWENSLVSGALMVRPLLGAALPQNIGEVGREVDAPAFRLYPNPGHDNLRISGLDGRSLPYRIVDAQGRVIATGTVSGNSGLDAGRLSPGMYFVQLSQNGIWSRPQRWVKL